jgi:protein-S-isoprenylcysteine O-methyltransferase Ste14
MSVPEHTPPSGEESRRLGWALVSIQFVLFVAVAAGALATGVGPRLPRSTPVGLVFVALGAALLLAAARHLGGALTANPVPNQSGLVAHGLYRWVRHPIYTGVFLACLGVSVGAGTVLAYVAVVCLVGLFEVKTRLEERWLAASYPGYADYAANTGKYVPRIGNRRRR